MKLPENFETEYFSLLTPVVTDGTLKNRRNLLVAAFSISLIYFLGKSLSEISFLGIKLDGADGKATLIAAFILIFFWFVMFCIHASKDAQINKERRHLLIQHTEKLKTSLDYSIEKYSGHADTHPNKIGIREKQNQYDIFLKQKERTKLATRLAYLGYLIEYTLPLIIGGYSMLLLIIDLYKLC